jgi:flavin reductase (DIM6/NTAB) family NADH-FMN oxidoreductase RutF
MKNKTRFDPMPVLFPHPTVIVGADVDGKPDLATVAWATIACGTPPWMAIALNRVRHSLKGVRQNMAFSVNIPNTGQVTETDYCGIATGSRDDKVADCKWDVFYGDVGGAPYVQQCPVNIGCTAEHILKLGSHYLIAGPIKEMYVSDDCLTDGKIDVAKIDPIVYLTHPAGTYHQVGGLLGRAFRDGKKIKQVPDDWGRQLAK